MSDDIQDLKSPDNARLRGGDPNRALQEVLNITEANDRAACELAQGAQGDIDSRPQQFRSDTVPDAAILASLWVKPNENDKLFQANATYDSTASDKESFWEEVVAEDASVAVDQIGPGYHVIGSDSVPDNGAVTDFFWVDTDDDNKVQQCNETYEVAQGLSTAEKEAKWTPVSDNEDKRLFGGTITGIVDQVNKESTARIDSAVPPSSLGQDLWLNTTGVLEVKAAMADNNTVSHPTIPEQEALFTVVEDSVALETQLAYLSLLGAGLREINIFYTNGGTVPNTIDANYGDIWVSRSENKKTRIVIDDYTAGGGDLGKYKEKLLTEAVALDQNPLSVTDDLVVAYYNATFVHANLPDGANIGDLFVDETTLQAYISNSTYPASQPDRTIFWNVSNSPYFSDQAIWSNGVKVRVEFDIFYEDTVPAAAAEADIWTLRSSRTSYKCILAYALGGLIGTNWRQIAYQRAEEVSQEIGAAEIDFNRSVFITGSEVVPGPQNIGFWNSVTGATLFDRWDSITSGLTTTRRNAIPYLGSTADPGSLQHWVDDGLSALEAELDEKYIHRDGSRDYTGPVLHHGTQTFIGKNGNFSEDLVLGQDSTSVTQVPRHGQVLLLDGSQAMQADLDMDGNDINNVPDATLFDQPATLGQLVTAVDDKLSRELSFSFSTATAGAPASNTFRFNNANPILATEIAFDAEPVGSIFNTVPLFISLRRGCVIVLSRRENTSGDTPKQYLFIMSGDAVDNSTWASLPVTFTSQNALGAFSASDLVDPWIIPKTLDSTDVDAIEAGNSLSGANPVATIADLPVIFSYQAVNITDSDVSDNVIAAFQTITDVADKHIDLTISFFTKDPPGSTEWRTFVVRYIHNPNFDTSGNNPKHSMSGLTSYRQSGSNSFDQGVEGGDSGASTSTIFLLEGTIMAAGKLTIEVIVAATSLLITCRSRADPDAALNVDELKFAATGWFN